MNRRAEDEEREERINMEINRRWVGIIISPTP